MSARNQATVHAIVLHDQSTETMHLGPGDTVDSSEVPKVIVELTRSEQMHSTVQTGSAQAKLRISDEIGG